MATRCSSSGAAERQSQRRVSQLEETKKAELLKAKRVSGQLAEARQLRESLEAKAEADAK